MTSPVADSFSADGRAARATARRRVLPGSRLAWLITAAILTLLALCSAGTAETAVPAGALDELSALHADHQAAKRRDVMLPTGPKLLFYAAALADEGEVLAARLLLGTILEDGGMAGDAAAVQLGTLVVLANTYVISNEPIWATLILRLVDGAGAESLSRLDPSTRARLDRVRAALDQHAAAERGASTLREWADQAQQLMAQLTSKIADRQALFAAFLAAFESGDPAAIDEKAGAFVNFVEPDDALGALVMLMTARRLTLGTDGPEGVVVGRDVAAGRRWLERLLDLPAAYTAAFPAYEEGSKHPVETFALASVIFRQESFLDAPFAVSLAKRAAHVSAAIGPERNAFHTLALEAHAASLATAGQEKAAETAWSRLVTYYETRTPGVAMTDEERQLFARAVAARAALLARMPGREQEAEAGFTDALRIGEAGGPAFDAMRFELLIELGDFLMQLARFDDALGVYRSAVALGEEVGRGETSAFVYALHRLGAVEMQTGALDNAARTLARAHSVGARTLAEDDPAHAMILDAMSEIFERKGEDVPAGLQQARDAARARQSDSVAPMYLRERAFSGKLGEAHTAFSRGDWDAAIKSAEEALALGKTYGDVGWTINALRVLAAIESRRENNLAALEYHRRVEELLPKSSMTTLADRQDGFLSHMQTAIVAAFESDSAEAADLYAEAFTLAQKLNRARVGGDLEKANLRRAVGNRPLAALLRRLQTDTGRREGLAAELTLALATGQPVTPIRNALDVIDAEIAGIQTEIERQFPAYADHLGDTITTFQEAAAVLAPNEALILFATRPSVSADGIFQSGAAIMLRRDAYAASIVSHDGDLAALSRRLRCAAALTDPRCQSQGFQSGSQRGAFSLDAPEEGQARSSVPAFDFGAAYAAYEALLAPLPLDLTLDGIDTLIIVPDSSLVAMPFHLMLREPVAPGVGFADAAWLLRDFSLTIAPTVSSFVGLRRDRSGSAMTARPASFLGIGDPLIGRQSNGPLAYDCGNILGRPVEAVALDLRVSQRGVLEDPLALRDLAALPDTECELAATAQAFGTEARLLIHEQANEAAIKQMSADGSLGGYSVVSFATHGLIAGEVGASNAGLVLTPPDIPGPGNDGLLTSAEIAALDLDADFVLLSACNTAAGNDADAEGLSGLASAFFFAGARNLLVSHWPVYSDAASRLTTRLFAELQRRPGLSRAGALRASMLAILDDPASGARQKHPAYWAPFMIVGEGGG